MPGRLKVQGDLFHGCVPESAIYAGRPAPGLPGSKFANPFGLKRRIGRNHPLRPYLDAANREVLGIDSGSRGGHWDIITPGVPSVAVGAYRLWLRDQPDLIRAAREELAGRDLACWCGPDDPCHCDVLLVLANEGTTMSETTHVEHTRLAGEKPYCACGQPWPCARDVTEPIAARLDWLRACVDAARVTPEAFDLEGLLGNLGDALAALDAVLALAAKHEHGALRWQDPLPVPGWIREAREAIAGALKVSTGA